MRSYLEYEKKSIVFYNVSAVLVSTAYTFSHDLTKSDPESDDAVKGNMSQIL